MTDAEYLADEDSAHFLPNHCCSRTCMIVTHVVPFVFHLSSPKRPEENAVGSRGAINYRSRKRDMQPKSICCKRTCFMGPYYFCIIVIILIVFSKSRHVSTSLKASWLHAGAVKVQAERTSSDGLINKSILILTFNTLAVPIFVFLWLRASTFARKCFKEKHKQKPKYINGKFFFPLADLNPRLYLTLDNRFRLQLLKNNYINLLCGLAVSSCSHSHQAVCRGFYTNTSSLFTLFFKLLVFLVILLTCPFHSSPSRCLVSALSCLPLWKYW